MSNESHEDRYGDAHLEHPSWGVGDANVYRVTDNETGETHRVFVNDNETVGDAIRRGNWCDES